MKTSHVLHSFELGKMKKALIIPTVYSIEEVKAFRHFVL